MSVVGYRDPVQVIVQPEDGLDAVVALIARARRTIIVKMFTFTSRTLIEALIGAAARGVGVRVLLNPQRSSGTRANDEVFAEFQSRGVSCAWSTAFVVTHEKSMVVDGRTVLIATFNFCDKYFTQTRDYGVVVEDAAIAREVTECFEADWQGTGFTPPQSALIWSNDTSRRDVCDVIDGAERSLLVHHPKFSDVTVLDRLLHAQDRGVRIKVLCGGRHGISDSDMLDTFSALRALRRAGVMVNKQAGLRLHAKLIVADGRRVLLGSMNIDRSAFDLRRELGIRIDDRDAVTKLAGIFHGDWELSSRYHAPDPMAAEAPPVETDHPHVPELVHE